MDNQPGVTIAKESRRIPWKRGLALLLAGIVISLWFAITPDGLLGKADAVGYAVCHRIDLRSFHIGDRPLPLCARCSGMYLGFALAAGYFWLRGRGRAGGYPSKAVTVVLAFFLLAIGLMLVVLVGTNLLFPPIPPEDQDLNRIFRPVRARMVDLSGH